MVLSWNTRKKPVTPLKGRKIKHFDEIWNLKLVVICVPLFAKSYFKQFQEWQQKLLFTTLLAPWED